MNKNNRLLGFLLTIIFMMVCGLNVYSVNVDDVEPSASKDLLKDANSTDDRKVATWNDAVLPMQVVLPRQQQSETSFGSSPFLSHFIALKPQFQYYFFTPLSYKANGSSPFRPLLSRFYYVIALERFLC